MKIFEIIPFLTPVGGAEMLVKTLTLQMKKQYHENEYIVVSLYDRKDGALIKALEDNGVEVVFLGKKRGIDLACAKRLRKLIDERKPDVCHLHLNCSLTFYLSKRAKRQANYLTIHNIANEKSFGSKKKPTNILIKRLLKSGKVKAVSISKIVDKSVKEFFSIEETSVIYNGTDVDLFKNDIPLAKRKNTFLAVGRFVEQKNHMLMIKAFEKLQKDFPSANLVLLGEGPLRGECENYAKENKIANIEFKGAVDNVNDYMKDSKCLLLSSLWEGNPIVINEAIAAGCWIISTGVGGVPDLIDETCGYLAKPSDEDDYYQKMKEFILNEERISRVIADNREENLERVSIKKCAEQYMSIFRKGVIE